ncbi:MAG: hypothetical protein ACUVWO_13735 [Thermodesulfobacteriota bacterium]
MNEIFEPAIREPFAEKDNGYPVRIFLAHPEESGESQFRFHHSFIKKGSRIPGSEGSSFLILSQKSA